MIFNDTENFERVWHCAEYGTLINQVQSQKWFCIQFNQPGMEKITKQRVCISQGTCMIFLIFRLKSFFRKHEINNFVPWERPGNFYYQTQQNEGASDQAAWEIKEHMKRSAIQIT